MRKTTSNIVKVAVSAMIISVALCGCMKKTFTCDLCMEEVKEVPNVATVMGEEFEICKDCKTSLEELGSLLG